MINQKRKQKQNLHLILVNFSHPVYIFSICYNTVRETTNIISKHNRLGILFRS